MVDVIALQQLERGWLRNTALDGGSKFLLDNVLDLVGEYCTLGECPLVGLYSIHHHGSTSYAMASYPGP